MNCCMFPCVNRRRLTEACSRTRGCFLRPQTETVSCAAPLRSALCVGEKDERKTGRYCGCHGRQRTGPARCRRVDRNDQEALR
ncbi:hypothetical protein CO656_18355 [Sinorhizobium sp. FG01]|nr:hypothetical protein CO656_18355 [Sinorhizobium sp. FG01]